MVEARPGKADFYGVNVVQMVLHTCSYCTSSHANEMTGTPAPADLEAHVTLTLDSATTEDLG